MKKPRKIWIRWWLEMVAILVLVAPLLVLLGAGLAWLYEQGWLLWWLVAAMGLTLATWGSLRLRHGRRTPRRDDEGTVTPADPGWAPHEQAAWETVQRLSREVDPSILDGERPMLAAAEHTIEEVARHYHPGLKEPMFEFTLPELLLLTERVSARLRVVLLDQVPLSHKLKARSLIRAWRYRPILAAGMEHGKRLYSLVRIVRAVSPLHAIAAEVRDHLIGDLFDSVQTNTRRRIVRLWVEEVGRAAIDLYSGRLRVDARELATAGAREALEGTADAPPLKLLVAGRTGAGKTTLVHCMVDELMGAMDVAPATARFQGYELRQEGHPPAYLIDSPGVDDEASVTEFVKRAFACDLILWVVAAHAPVAPLDREALDAMRARFAANPQRKMPPLVVVASHADQIDLGAAGDEVGASGEWDPPYDLETPATDRERALLAAVERLAAELRVPVENVVPMRISSDAPGELDALWIRLDALVSEAQRARWVRILRGSSHRRGWRKPWRQLAGAGRIVKRLIRR